MTVRIKICCIASVAEAELAVRHGAAALGFVSAMPSGPGPIAEERIAEVADRAPPGVATFLLTSRTDAEGIIEQQHRCRCNTLQLVDAVDPRIYPRLRRAMPGIKIVQVIHVIGNASVGEALDLAPQVDALLLDSGNPTLPVKVLGGTGRTHDWALSRYIVAHAGKPVFLAGGLRPENVVEAIRTVQPYGVDLCNGVRTDGALDPEKLEAFVAAARSA